MKSEIVIIIHRSVTITVTVGHQLVLLVIISHVPYLSLQADCELSQFWQSRADGKSFPQTTEPL